MQQKQKFSFSKLLFSSLWALIAAGIIVVTVGAIGNKSDNRVANIKVIISGDPDKLFMDQDEIMQLLEKSAGKALKNQSIGTLDLTTLEKQLEKNQWIEKAELFFDNTNTLQVKVKEAIPVARVYSVDGNSFYISSSSKLLPLSDRISARLPVFTGFPQTSGKIKKADSAIAAQVLSLATFIKNNPFWMSQIDQIDITENENFVFVPKLGNQIIRFGNADNYEAKFSKLMAFYRQVQTKTGWNKYSVIDLQFNNQVVAVKRDAAEIKADSLAAIRIMKKIIEDAKIKSADSNQVQLPIKEDAGESVAPKKVSNSDYTNSVIPENTKPETSANPPIFKPTPAENKVIKNKKKEAPVKKTTVAPAKKNDEKEKEVKENEDEKRVPKAVMPAKNEKENEE